MQVFGYAMAWVALTVGIWLELPLLLAFDDRVRQALVNEEFASVAGYLTHAGDPGVMLALALTLLGVLLWWREWDAARLVAGAMCGVAMFRWAVLWIVERPRPAGGEWAFGSSYPSGHTAYSATAALVLFCLILPSLYRPWQRHLLVAVTVLWPVTVAATRVQLGVHWPIDVLAGLVLAVIVLTAVLRMSEHRLGSWLWDAGFARQALS